VLLLLCSLSLPSHAQPLPAFEGQEVTVVGKRPQTLGSTPAFVTVIPGDELRRLGFVTLADALAFVAEAYLQTNIAGPAGLTRLSIRGSTPQQVLVLLDGIPLVGATTELGVDLSAITLSDVERVEILRGPFSAIYGSGALGGVVQIVTSKRPLRTLSVEFGSSASGRLALRLGSVTSSLLSTLGVEGLTTGGYLPNGAGWRWTANGRFELRRPGPATLNVALHHTSGREGVPLFAGPRASLRDGRTILTLGWSSGESENPIGKVYLWWQGDILDYRDPPFYTSLFSGSTLGLESQRILRVGEDRILTIGGSWYQTRNQFSDPFSRYDAVQAATALYAQVDTPIGEKTLLGLGLRLDTHSVYGSQLNPRVGFVRFLAPEIRIRGGLGRTFRGPNSIELYFPGCSDPALRPESAWAADLGLDLEARPGLLVRADGFYSDAKDLIRGGCPPANVGSARVMGASLEVAGSLDNRWSVMANLTWTDGVDRTSGLPILRLPAWQANLIVRRTSPAGSSFSILASYVGERSDLDYSVSPPQRVLLPGNVVIGLRYGHKVGDWEFRVGVDNLLDSAYETLKGYPAPGRMFSFQLSRREW
jgi:outer membrane cobalamin receptor